MKISGRSLWVYHLPCADCGGCRKAVELLESSRIAYEHGLSFVKSIKSADCIIVTGMLNYCNLEEVRRKMQMISRPAYLIAAGACAVSGGIFDKSYNHSGVLDGKLGVSYFIPGCPPSEEDIAAGLKELIGLQRKTRKPFKKKKWKELLRISRK